MKHMVKGLRFPAKGTGLASACSTIPFFSTVACEETEAELSVTLELEKEVQEVLKKALSKK